MFKTGRQTAYYCKKVLSWRFFLLDCLPNTASEHSLPELEIPFCELRISSGYFSFFLFLLRYKVKMQP